MIIYIKIDNLKEVFNYLYDRCLKRVGYERYGEVVNCEKFGCYLVKLFNYNISNKSSFFVKAEQIFHLCDEKWKPIVKGVIEGAMNNVKGGMHWEFIQCGVKALKRKKPLISPYFALFDHNDKKKFLHVTGGSEKENIQGQKYPFLLEKALIIILKEK